MKKYGKYKPTDKEIAWHYLKTFTDTTREPFLILDSKLRVVGASSSFYNNFHVSPKETENKLIYELGNRQWDISELRNLLENILPKKTVFNDFKVSHNFPGIGTKIMMLNARSLDDTQQILLAIEDITLKMAIKTKLANYTKNLERGVVEKTKELQVRIDELNKLNDLMAGRELKMVKQKEEIADLKQKIKNMS